MELDFFGILINTKLLCVIATALAMMVVSEYVSTFYVLFLCIVFFNFIPCMPSGHAYTVVVYGPMQLPAI